MKPYESIVQERVANCQEDDQPWEHSALDSVQAYFMEQFLAERGLTQEYHSWVEQKFGDETSDQ